ncbi:D-Alanine-poly(phosphoribitol) ligase [Acididesulfobacillus acetoxydans]|uniref:D-Alanine-poly(Phosphoribitol) ligase n=1 Tax=Acididesulfobacillus acetoxydans TaxID=1561005 RepID=A0A8S0Y3Q2_9FIRM|nr:D-alanine--poly(phosphoribitol) ligase subunit DltC [Acididesulfobacillus acetoxydans]CAA7602295.1 D-Alanine-poly(phosphoribitol) ligase [Acididesulfobacillus acetoxydans]CEJ07487.1 dltC: D-alanine--poly(phosphoribitol) ligase, subunit 2 [Acididesulfobacillus acetoxydans]
MHNQTTTEPNAEANNQAKIRSVILSALTDICGTAEVADNLQLDLFAHGLLDSFGLVELMLTIHEQLGLEIAPTEVERETWSTPEKIIGYLEGKAR